MITHPAQRHRPHFAIIWPIFLFNSNFDIAKAEDPSAQALAMSKFDFLKNWLGYGKVRFPKN